MAGQEDLTVDELHEEIARLQAALAEAHERIACQRASIDALRRRRSESVANERD